MSLVPVFSTKPSFSDGSTERRPARKLLTSGLLRSPRHAFSYPRNFKLNFVLMA